MSIVPNMSIEEIKEFVAAARLDERNQVAEEIRQLNFDVTKRR